MASFMASTDKGSKYNAGSPPTPGRDNVFDKKNGVPQLMASKGGSPKPSCRDGKMNEKALA